MSESKEKWLRGLLAHTLCLGKTWKARALDAERERDDCKELLSRTEIDRQYWVGLSTLHREKEESALAQLRMLDRLEKSDD